MKQVLWHRIPLASIAALVLVACTSTGTDWSEYYDHLLDDPSGPAARVRAAQLELQHAPLEATRWADLGDAWFEAARATLDPVAVRRARDAFTRSQALSANERAAEGLAFLALFRQRFADASRRFDVLRSRHPNELRFLAPSVEAAIGQGDAARAEQLIALTPDSLGDARGRAARALLWLERGDNIGAACEYVAADALARPTSPADADRYALSAAAAYLAAGDSSNAARLLLPFEALAPAHARAEILLAELAFAGRVHSDAAVRAQLVRCETLLGHDATPELHAAAARLARALDDAERAETHTLAAEDAFSRVEAAGETYTLAPLARLYALDDDDLDRALELARRHARAVHDRGARALIEELELRRARLARAKRAD